MSKTKQDYALTALNSLIDMMGRFAALRSQMTDFIKAYNSESYGTTWANLSTAIQNADGSLGSADIVPNTAHPIDPRVYNIITRDITQIQALASVTFLNDFQNFLSNQSVSTANRNQTLDDAAN